MNQSSDQLHRFIFDHYQIRGELVQLQQTTHDILAGHDYPPAIAHLLAELTVASSLLTATLKFEGTITIQLQGDGPLRFMVVNGDHHQHLRGVARYEGPIADNASLHDLIGKGHMMITIIPDEGERYQGIVALEGETLAACLENYFLQSEQLATRIWIRTGSNPHTSSLQAAGMLLQEMPHTDRDEHTQDFEHVVVLTDTIKTEELFELGAEEILYRLYNQEDVHLFPAQDVQFECHCSRDRCEAALLQIGQNETESLLVEHGEIDMACDYCGTTYVFTKADVTKIFAPAGIQQVSTSLH
jgi:molecular chaperone Hsp33